MPPPSSRRLDGSGPTDRVVLRAGLGVLVLLLLVGGALLGGSLFRGNDDASPVAGPSAAPSPSSLPSEAVTAPSATTSSSPSATSTDVPGFVGMKNFVVQYLDTVTGSTANGWEQLTPRFRSRSGGYAAYRGFWGEITKAVPGNFDTGPRRDTISYDVTYTHADGHTSMDSTTLRLRFRDGRFRVAGEG